MSDRLDYAEFPLARKRLTTDRSPINSRELNMWLSDCRNAFDGIRYLHVTRVALGDSNDAMIEIGGTISYPSQEMEYIRRDFEKFFGKELSVGTRGVHAFSFQGESFMFMFCCVTRNNDYVTGRLRAAVSRKAAA